MAATDLVGRRPLQGPPAGPWRWWAAGICCCRDCYCADRLAESPDFPETPKSCSIESLHFCCCSSANPSAVVPASRHHTAYRLSCSYLRATQRQGRANHDAHEGEASGLLLLWEAVIDQIRWTDTRLSVHLLRGHKLPRRGSRRFLIKRFADLILTEACENRMATLRIRLPLSRRLRSNSPNSCPPDLHHPQTASSARNA